MKFVAGLGVGLTMGAAALAQTDYSAIEADPAIYVISDDDSTVYILGTVHILHPDLDWRSPSISAALNDAEAVYFEADVMSPEAQAQAQSLLLQLGMNAPGVTLSSMTSDEAKEYMAVIAGRLGSTPEMLQAQTDPMQPWLASIVMAVMQIQMAGYDPASGVESKIHEAASEAGKRFGYF